MARDVITVKPTDNLDYCMELMSTKRIRHLPVLENNAVLGVISIGDVVKSIIEIQKRNNSVFDSYISGKKS
jgi:CBS domain-containing protein